MKIIATWDDAAVWDLRVAELMQKYKIKTIFYWPVMLEKSKNVGRVGKFLSMDQCKQLAKDFEVGSHTVTHHHLTKINAKQARNEVFDSRKQWQDLTGQEINSFCYPRGYQSVLVRALVKNAGYKDARLTSVGHLRPADDPYMTPTTLHVGIDRVEYGNKSWEIYGREMLEKAKQEEDVTFHIMGHSWEIERENDWKALDQFLKEVTDAVQT